jgi:amidase
MVTGVEIPGNIKVKVDVIKDSKLNNPMLEDSEYIYTIASHEDLMTAVRTSTEGMHTYIMDKLAMSYNEAGMLLSAAGNVQICQVVDPKLTVRFAFPKKYL